MTFLGRWFASVCAAFVCFPVVFVLIHGPDAEWGFTGGMMLMAFMQFLSPYNLWQIPLGVGTALAIAWHATAHWKANRHQE